MKKSRGIIAVVFLVTMLAIYMPKTAIGMDFKIAIPNTSEVLVDGVSKKFEAYTIQTVQGENIEVRDSFYYINETLDEKFYNNDLESYRIFKYDKGKTRRISNNRAYEFCQIGNSIYYIKMDYLGREDGSAQTGSLWKLDLDNDDETLVLEDNIYTIASDGKYIYFTRYDDLGNDNIMRMEPGKQAEIFLKDCKSYRLAYSNGWLYYVEDKSYNIMRININTKEKQKVSENRADPESELKFIIYGDMLIMPTHDTNWNSIVVKENIVTHEKKVMPNDNINYLGISKAGTLYYLDTDREEIIFTKFE